MEKHLLVTASGDTSYLYGVRFVSSFVRKKASVKVTILCVGPFLDEERKAHQHGLPHPISQKAATGPEASKLQTALESCRKLLCDKGFLPENISTKLSPRHFGTVKDIIKEARAGQYDAVVLGRRGYTMFESFLSNSVSKDLLSRDVDIPIWVCRLPEEHRRNVLLCVDGSDASLRIADHVGFMLEEEDEHTVTIVHVDTGHVKDKDTMFQQAKAVLTGNGVPEERISIKVIRSSNVVRSIMEEANEKSYAVIAAGRIGLQKSAFAEWMLGSRVMKLLDNINKTVLWVSS